MTEDKKAKLFFCYAEEDEAFYREFETHLAQLRNSGLVESWHIGNLKGGDTRKSEITMHLDEADIILLLISADFLAAERTYEVEMKRALERHARREARVIPILLRPVDHKDAPFAKLHVLPLKSRPITLWSDRDEAWMMVVTNIRAILQGKDVPHVSSVSACMDRFNRSIHNKFVVLMIILLCGLTLILTTYVKGSFSFQKKPNEINVKADGTL